MWGWNRFVPVAIVGTIVSLLPISAAVALDPEQIANKAAEFIVKIDGVDSQGTGFIVRKNGNRYTVLTNEHVIRNAGDYTITTNSNGGRTYNINSSQTRKLPGVDLAEIEFTASDYYDVAELSDERTNSYGTTIYAFGWTAARGSFKTRSLQLLPGMITGNLGEGRKGYTLASTLNQIPGLSGSPLLDKNGKVIGIYGSADVQTNQGTTIVTLALGIPISTYQNYLSSGNANTQSSNNSSSTRQPSTSSVEFVSSLLYTRTHSDGVNSVAISPDGQTIASASTDKTIKIWRLQDGQLLRTLTGHDGTVGSVAISPNGQSIVSASWDGTIKVWRLRDGELLRTLKNHAFRSGITAQEIDNRIFSVLITPDGETIVSGNADKTIKIWRLSNGQLLRTIAGHGDLVTSLAITPNGKNIVSGGHDYAIKVWRLNDGQLLRTFSSDKDPIPSFESASISPDGEILVSAHDYTIKIWRLRDGKLLRTISAIGCSNDNPIISKDGQKIIAGSNADDNAIRIWRLRDGQLLRTIYGHNSSSVSLAISPNGKTLVSGSFDRTIKVWQLSPSIFSDFAPDPPSIQSESIKCRM
jgi:WD40 repeat protein